MKSQTILQQLKLSFRCPLEWEGMVGDARQRHCEKCAKSVTDLSTLSESEAARFLCENPEACVRIWRNQAGEIVTKGCGVHHANSKQAAKAVARPALALGALALASCSSGASPGDGPKTVCLPTMGMPFPIENDK